MKNHELVINQAKEKVKENLKFTIYDGATIMSMDELAKLVKDVCVETLSFLSSDVSSRERSSK